MEHFDDGRPHSVTEVAQKLTSVIPAAAAIRIATRNKERHLDTSGILNCVDLGRMIAVRRWLNSNKHIITVKKYGPRQRIDVFQLHRRRPVGKLEARRRALALLKGRYPWGAIKQPEAEREARALHLNVIYVKQVVYGSKRAEIEPIPKPVMTEVVS